MKKIFIAVLIFRLVISFLPSMQIDMGCWQAWAMRMVEIGPQNFYSTKIFTDNPPGYLYIFGVVGGIKGWLEGLVGLGIVNFEWLLKLPGNLFDLGTGLLIYKIISHKRGGLSWLGLDLAKLGFLLYTLNPAVWFNSSVFGQFDGVGAFFGLLSVYLIIDSVNRKDSRNLILAGVAFAVAWAVKPQAIALAPAIGVLIIRKFREFGGFRRIGGVIRVAGAFILTTLLLYWPFFPKNPLSGVFYVFSRMNNIYSCTTCFAFNFWGIFGNWGNDRALFLGIPLMVWGIILGGLGMLGVLIPSLRAKRGNLEIASSSSIPRNDARIYLAIAISVMAFFMFVTRMHERYLLLFFPFMLIAAMLLKSKFLMLYYIFISGLSLLNVYYPYANYNTDLHLTPGLVVWLGEHFRALSMVSFGSFLVLLCWYLFDRLKGHSLAGRRPISKGWPYEAYNAGPAACSSRPTCSPATALALILLFAFFSRVWRLDTPKTFYFDEVYHAFTAVELEKGNKMAWEWWNTPPAGFAYEWTHPPLAKETMVLSIRGFRELRGLMRLENKTVNPFDWRFPGVLAGVGVIFLIYLLGKQLFNVRVGLIAAFLGSLDGLLFTQSRIGMNDIYFLFFTLLAFYLFIKQIGQRRDRTAVGSQRSLLPTYVGIRQIGLIGVGIALGLALASKWTAVYGIGILGGLYIISGLIKLIKAWPCSLARPGLVKLIAVFLFTFLIIPVFVYLLIYLPFFRSGHSWAQFDELQHQMWWYHTGLKATHPYTSSWYSWPFLQRPVWYFVEYGKETVANIYGLGNPVIWWAGIGAVGWIIVILLRRLAEVAHAIFSGTNCLRSSKIGDLPASLLIVLAGYFGFFLPWALSPRIMFLYHYLPSLPFLCLALGWGLDRIGGKLLTFAFLLLTFVTFVYFYPQLSALAVPKWWSDQYFWFTSWR